MPIEVIISTEYKTTVTITSPHPGINRVLQIAPPGLQIPLPADVALNGTGLHQKAILVESTMAISVYVFHDDGYFALPTRYLRSNYYVPITDHSDCIFAISPVNSSARVDIVQLNGEIKTTVDIPVSSVYYVKSVGVFRGAIVSSNTTIAVVGGRYTSFDSVGGHQTLVEYLVSPADWDRNYIIPHVKDSTMKYSFLYPKMYGTSTLYTVYNISQASTFTLGRNLYFKFIKTSSDNWYFIRSNNDTIGLIDWNFGKSVFNSFMTTIPGLSQFSNNYRFATPSYQGQTFVAIIVRQRDTSGLELDSSAIISPDSSYTVSIHMIEILYSVITVKISTGWHIVRHTDPDVKFGLIMYGGSVQASYGLPLGLQLN